MPASTALGSSEMVRHVLTSACVVQGTCAKSVCLGGGPVRSGGKNPLAEEVLTVLQPTRKAMYTARRTAASFSLRVAAIGFGVGWAQRSGVLASRI
jgi:hypothetical protein